MSIAHVHSRWLKAVMDTWKLPPEVAPVLAQFPQTVQRLYFFQRQPHREFHPEERLFQFAIYANGELVYEYDLSLDKEYNGLLAFLQTQQPWTLAEVFVNQKLLSVLHNGRQIIQNYTYPYLRIFQDLRQNEVWRLLAEPD